MMTVTKHPSQRDNGMFASIESRTAATGKGVLLAASLLTAVLFAFASQVNAQSMRTSLLPVMPANDPYCGTSGQFPSIQPCQDMTLSVGVGAAGGDSSFPAGVVDWVLVELREAANAADAAANGVGVVKARKPALLLSNGRVVDAEFVNVTDPDLSNCNGVAEDEANCPAVSFGEDSFMDGNVPTTFPGSGMNAYVVVRHRNHLAVMSAGGVSLESNAGGYDFSTALTQSHGNNGVKAAGSASTPAMIAGDADRNGQTRGNDVNLVILPDAVAGQNGYYGTDADMNAQVRGNDANLVSLPNALAGFDSAIQSSN